MMDDCISRQAAIEALKGMAVPLYKDPACEDIWERDRTLDNAIDAIRGLPSAQPEQRWIPCSERLPKYNTPVLLALKQIGKERTIVIGERRTRKSGWYFVDIAAYDSEHKVIAWRPLPEPYREESEDKK